MRTGIGQAVAEVVDALGRLDAAPDLVPYALSLRARRHRADLPPATRFLPVPARVLLRTWAVSGWPAVDRWVGDADVVHATNYLAPPSRRPTVVSVYDCSFVRFPELTSAERRRFEPVIRRALRRGAWVHTGSTFVATEIREVFGDDLAGPDRVVVVPLGVPRLDPDGPLPPALAARVGDGPYVLALGALEPRKNLDRLVTAFGALAPDHPDLRLVVAGPDGPARPAVERARGELSPTVAERVVLLGPVSDGARAALLASASVLAYPSLYEGFGFPVLEAMAAGVPVVAAAAGSIPEIAGGAAALVDAQEVEELAGALAAVLDDADRRSALVADGRARAATFTWEATGRGLVDLYTRAASG